jgi:sugar-specific transcriptional regulator TrmB
MAKKSSPQAEKVWKYLLKNKLATPAEVSKATGVSYGYVYKLMKKVGTPKEVFVQEAKAFYAAPEKPSLWRRILNVFR